MIAPVAVSTRRMRSPQRMTPRRLSGSQERVGVDMAGRGHREVDVQESCPFRRQVVDDDAAEQLAVVSDAHSGEVPAVGRPGQRDDERRVAAVDRNGLQLRAPVPARPAGRSGSHRSLVEAAIDRPSGDHVGKKSESSDPWKRPAASVAVRWRRSLPSRSTVQIS